MSELKPCPFCSGEAMIKEERWHNPDVGYPDNQWFVGICVNCRATGQKITYKPFNQFSDYSVQDFRENNALRAKYEDRYDEYLENKKQEAMRVWNKRA